MVNLKIQKILLSIVLSSICCWGFLFYQLPDNLFHIYFLDIGQGDAIFIKTPENHQILVDGGPGNAVIEQLGQVMPYFDRSIDFVVLTHPDYDHMGGLVEVLKRYEVNKVLMTGVDVEKDAYEEFLKEILRKNITVYAAEAGVDFDFGAVSMDIIYPFDQMLGQKVENANDSSVSMKIEYKDRSILLTGDLEELGENQLLAASVNLKSDIYKAGHHGSKSSSSLKFLQAVAPEIAVIQVGKDNSYGHPHQSVLDNFEKIGLKKIYRTDYDGRIEFVF